MGGIDDGSCIERLLAPKAATTAVHVIAAAYFDLATNKF